MKSFVYQRQELYCPYTYYRLYSHSNLIVSNTRYSYSSSASQIQSLWAQTGRYNWLGGYPSIITQIIPSKHKLFSNTKVHLVTNEAGQAMPGTSLVYACAYAN